MLLKILLFALVAVTFQEHHKHKHHHHRGPPSEEHMPSFLKNVSSDARKEFFGIVKDRKTPRNEIRKKADEWARKQGGSVLEELHKFDDKKKAYFNDIHKNVSIVISKLEAAHSKAHKIVTDDKLSKDEMFEKLRNLDIDPVVGRALRAVIFTVAHPHHPIGRPHGRHHSHRNSSSYEGLGGLAAILGHGEKGDKIVQIGPGSNGADSDSE
ncbi:unnamed protein product [Cylicocyclus nassatus]|uniref:SXP/RAL-2 family protein Ani s 5-like cation-binding domain-containing protein n=1 Tax=Cylicocyclus nassatus TaxID=53992 RepID=A0AA36GWV6_CYLNA|nr:unnamed protein product [Cylicocyclus nassatus]